MLAAPAALVSDAARPGARSSKSFIVRLLSLTPDRRGRCRSFVLVEGVPLRKTTRGGAGAADGSSAGHWADDSRYRVTGFGQDRDLHTAVGPGGGLRSGMGRHALVVGGTGMLRG